MVSCTSESEVDFSGLFGDLDQNSPCSYGEVHFKQARCACPGHLSGWSDPIGDQVSHLHVDIIACLRLTNIEQTQVKKLLNGQK